MMVLVLGAIETSDMIFLRQILKSAAYEGARTATAPGKTAAAGIAAANQVLTQRGVISGTASCSPAVTVSTATGTSVTFTVTAPMASNCCVAPVVIASSLGNMTVTVTMIRQ
jgi:Flp pilus assembly protein TadG